MSEIVLDNEYWLLHTVLAMKKEPNHFDSPPTEILAARRRFSSHVVRGVHFVKYT